MAQMHTDIKRLEAELNYPIYPGTEVMKDTAGVEFIKSDSGVLIPQPSNDPTDPLNWTGFWKGGAIFTAVFLGFFQGFGPLALSSQVPFYIKDFDTTVNGVINFIGVTILVLGFSNFIWVPVATQFGRRPAALASTVICLGSMIWRARAKTYHSFLGACIVNGIGAGPAETLPPMIIADVQFLHTRGTYMGLYWWAYFGSLMVGPVVSGTMSDRYGWQSFWWLNAAMAGFLIVCILFLLPETKFRHIEKIASSNGSITKGEEDQISNVGIERHVDDALGNGKPSVRQYLPVAGFEKSKKQLIRDLITPWTLFAFPIVHWSSFVVSWSSSCFLCLNLTQSFVFAAPPYNFSAQSVGFTNLAVLGGAILGLVTAGPLSDLVSRIGTRRNGNIREPEMRLPSLWPYCIVLAIGTTVVALGYQHHWDWKIIIILGYSAIGFQVASIPPIAMTYAIDSYTPVAGEFLVSMTVNKNLWGYGVSQFLVPWILKSGFVTPLMVNTGLTIAFTLLGSIALMFYGKTLRKWTRNSYVHSMSASV